MSYSCRQLQTCCSVQYNIFADQLEAEALLSFGVMFATPWYTQWYYVMTDNLQMLHNLAVLYTLGLRLYILHARWEWKLVQWRCS